ncbi:uncharacterized protein V1518DRAFT_411169 [Limtongia smithiae]|uniref:uncharacterized protein n=1 Tax=Limtongia smithiae TaxID=1125753 RepID=UPI0034CF3845
MHPNLDDPNYIDCSDLIAALHECHTTLGAWKSQFGCNNIKDDLNRCLHNARLQRRHQNNDEGRRRGEALRRFNDRSLDDIYGPHLAEMKRRQMLQLDRDITDVTAANTVPPSSSTATPASR